ncbi:prolyl-tRNA synthetase associated domain-containing protein [Streptobacillus felis]|uniref:Prolyl-tRNA synthetase associated domain-containing protein n=1 Tax=Streptobacillus felis TaxID=1384509 RepID=A0A7Z0PFQ9_9FUSO|nr:YbaK/EbsC family protein [Streptobacillus felis]NYV27235.1 prolyl-tRNA synthetase associated domain-containing protein [Streptobacillus felis]
MGNEEMIYELLNKMNIKYKTLEHEAISSVKDHLFELEGQQVKNLLLKAKKTNNIYLVLIHDEKSLNLSDLAEKLEEKRLSFASSDTMFELTGCEPGVLTPFGLLFDKEHKISLIVDTAVDINTTIGAHPFINTKTLNIQFKDFEKFFKHTGHKINFIEL